MENQAPMDEPSHVTTGVATGSKKKLFIKTFGCQMNVYDSTRMADVLAPLGYAPVASPEGADMVIMNTCHIREKATEKVFSDLGRLRPLKQDKENDGGKMILAVAGCVAQAEGAEIMRRAPYVDIVLGPQTYHRLPEMVARATRAAEAKNPRAQKSIGVLDTDFPVESKFDFLPEASLPQGAVAFLSVQEGCDKFCTFCVVPYTRGAEFSRPAEQILSEAKKLLSQGAKEIHLLGQNVNAYHGVAPKKYLAKGKLQEEWGLGRLIREIAEMDGVERIRYTTSHPRDMSDDLIDAHRDVEKLMPYLHLPIQSGSDRVLELMNRKHKADDYRRVVDKLRSARPGLALSSDFIIGFPGETDKDFADTMKLIEDIDYAQAYSFKYSPRPGTPASAYETQVDEEIKSARLTALQKRLVEQQIAFNEKFSGQTIKVLFERGTKKNGQIQGRTPHMQMVNATAPERLIGQIVDVKITAAHDNSLKGEIVTGEYESASISNKGMLEQAEIQTTV